MPDAYDRRESVADDLDTRGYAVVPDHFSPQLCERLVRVCNDTLGPDAVEVADTSWMPATINPYDPENPPWSEANLATLLERGKPCVTSRRYRHEIRHPIFSEALSEATTCGRMVELHERLLRSAPGRLRLMQHMLVRTDHDPDSAAGPRDWHAGETAQPPITPLPKPLTSRWAADHAYLPQDYAASPRRIFYHAVVALRDIRPGGGGASITPILHTPRSTPPLSLRWRLNSLAAQGPCSYRSRCIARSAWRRSGSAPPPALSKSTAGRLASAASVTTSAT